MSEKIDALIRQIDELKSQLRQARLENSPTPIDDYSFESPHGDVKLSELFSGSQDLLIWHNMGKSCEYCALWADGLTGYVKQIQSRVPVVLVSPDPVSDQQSLAQARGWNFPMVRDADKAFSIATGFYQESGESAGFWPGLSAFHKNQDGSLEITNSTVFGPGDDFCLAWPAFELLKGGIAGWEPLPVQ